MKWKIVKTRVLVLSLLPGILVLLSCDESSILGNTSTVPDPLLTQGIPASEMEWVSWNPEVKEKITRLEKEAGTQSRRIGENGGRVGGYKTFGNKVAIPEDAIPEETLEDGWRDRIRITVKVNCVDGREQCGAGVDFLPSMKFQKDVKVTLSWEFLDWDGGELEFSAFFSEDNGKTWYEVDVVEIDYDNKTLSIYVDHFTRFAWAR